MAHLPTVTPDSLRNALAAAKLLAGAKRLGLDAVNDDGRVLLGFAALGVRAEVVDVVPQQRGVAVQLSIMVRGAPFAEGWHDQVGGFGPDEEAAVSRAVEGWCTGPLDLLRDAFSQGHAEYRYELPQEGPQGTTTWAVFEGPLQLVGLVHVQQSVLAACEETPPFTLLAGPGTLPVLDPARSHVLKLFAARAPDGATQAEVRVDSVTQEAAEKALARFSFPETTTIASLRQYFVLRPVKR